VSEWNPRFVAYAYAHGREPQAQIDRDMVLPTGMLRFTAWNKAQWSAWAAERGGMPAILSTEHHADYDRWLAARWPAPVATEVAS
jgi:hypothetical protein